MLLPVKEDFSHAIGGHDRANFRLAERRALLGLYQSKLVTTEVSTPSWGSKTLEEFQ